VLPSRALPSHFLHSFLWSHPLELNPAEVELRGSPLQKRGPDVRSWEQSRPAAVIATPTLLVESRSGAVALGRTYLLPPLSSGGALRAATAAAAERYPSRSVKVVVPASL
jgi:hypothetical protein